MTLIAHILETMTVAGFKLSETILQSSSETRGKFSVMPLPVWATSLVLTCVLNLYHHNYIRPIDLDELMKFGNVKGDRLNAYCDHLRRCIKTRKLWALLHHPLVCTRKPQKWQHFKLRGKMTDFVLPEHDCAPQ